MLIRNLLFSATLVVTFTASTHAAKPDKEAKSEKRTAARVLSRFDRDNDRTLDATEAGRVRVVFQTLKALDADRNGELSDSEISAAKIAGKGGSGKKRKQR